MERFPHTSPATWPAPHTGRVASMIRTDHTNGCQVALLGLPDDLGVRLNNGRSGAAQAPGAFRGALSRYGVSDPGGWDWPSVYDAGDVVPVPGNDSQSLVATHQRVTECAKSLVEAGLFPIAIGGGHDLTFAFVRGVLQGLRLEGKAVGLYFDAHLDVRESVGSGMPFRRLIEECGVRRLHLHGFSPMVNSREHLAYFNAHGGRLDSLSGDPESGSVDPYPSGELFVSLDMDVFDAAFAPGVSALNPHGKSPGDILPHLVGLGKCRRVRCFDIMELNPVTDEGGRTARLAAHAFLSFLRGFSDRK